MNYKTNEHVRNLAGCVNYLLTSSFGRETYKKDFEALYKETIRCTQMDELAKDDDWDKWARQIVLAAKTAVCW